MTKQISQSESKIKNLEDDVNKMKRTKETLEKQIKTEGDKHARFKQKFEKDLINAKKAMTDKERELQKIKQDLKKTDQ
jgi:predicted  nucleic acid-binding Zn-ribbon protein